MKRILLAIGTVALLGAAALVAVFHWFGSPTHGAPIDPAARGTALLVVDVQEDYTGPAAKRPYRDAARLVGNLNRVVRGAAERGWSIVFIRNDLPDNPFSWMMAGGTSIHDTPGVRLDARLERPTSAVEIPKARSDAFSNPEFDTYLREQRVRRVVVTGLDAAYCVRATTGGARNRGYETVVVGDVIATESGTPLPKLLDAYREMGATVETIDEVLSVPPSTGAR